MLKGKGMFIWEIQNCDGGNAQQIVARARAAGLTHVQVKIADGRDRYPYEDQYDTMLVATIAALQNAGITVWGWQFVYGRDRYNTDVRTAVEEADIAADRVQALGLAGFAVDLEETGNPVWTWHGDEVDCRNYMTRLRERLGSDFPIAACSHRFPRTYQWTEEWQRLWNEFMPRCNYAMPQVYWLQAHNAADQLQTSYDQYRQLWPHLTYVPVGAAYYEGWANWTATPEEVRQFLQKARELNMPAASFWSWQHARNDPHNPDYPGTELWDAIAAFDWPVEPVELPVRLMYVTARLGLNLRDGPFPGDDHWVAGILIPYGSSLTAIGNPTTPPDAQGYRYQQVRAADGREGWVVYSAGNEVYLSDTEPPPPPSLLIGLHDEPGGHWMRNQGMRGVCLVPRAVQTQPTTINCLNLAHAGIKVLVRLNWGWADGTGTVPPPEHEDAWVDAIIATIAASRDKGVWGWIIGNEVNNPVEWPGGYPNPTYMVSPAYYVRLYNRIWMGVQVNDLIAPVPLDPYNVVAQQFGQPADPRDWAQYIYAHIAGADFLALHTKTQGNDPAECWSDATFTDWPLIGRFLHLRTIEDQLGWVSARLRGKRVYVTEVNPQRRDADSLGWEPGNAEWVCQACAYLRTQPLAGAAFYRYQRAGDQAPFGLDNKPVILAAIKEEA